VQDRFREWNARFAGHFAVVVNGNADAVERVQNFV